MGVASETVLHFDDEASAAFGRAEAEASRRRHQAVTTTHVLWALLDSASVRAALSEIGIPREKPLWALSMLLDAQPRWGLFSYRPPTRAFHEALERAAAEAASTGLEILSPSSILARFPLSDDERSVLERAGFSRLAFRRYLAHGRVDLAPIPHEGTVSVVFFDDPFTTMETVVKILQSHFGIADPEALMLRVRRSGSAVVASLNARDAAPKIEAARKHGESLDMPLRIEARSARG